MERYSIKQKMVDVLKKYGYYMLLGFLLFSIVLTLIIVSLTSNKQTPEPEPTNVTVSAYMPVLNASIYKGYHGDELVFNSTLKQWETHNAIDFQVANGSKVYSILDGKVIDVYANDSDGHVVVIDHQNGLKSTYGSLDENVYVKIGDTVYRGDEIGLVSASADAEMDAGAHLHFAMTENDKKIDPSSYLNISTK